MKKIVALLIVVGVLFGTFATAAAECEKLLFEDKDFPISPAGDDNPDNPAPCGGGSGSGQPG